MSSLAAKMVVVESVSAVVGVMVVLVLIETVLAVMLLDACVVYLNINKG